MILGITGGTGCGKTTLLRLIQQRGGMVLDCDEIYHRLLTSDNAMLSAIQAWFPQAFPQGALERKKLGQIVFADPAALEELNAITHRAVRNEVLRRLGEKPPLAAIDAIGLFESGLNELCDITIAVTAPPEDRVARLMLRDGIGEAYARSRIAAQHEGGWFRSRCDYVLENNSTQDAFLKKCIAFLDTNGIMEYSSKPDKL